MSQSTKSELLEHMRGRYPRMGREGKTRVLDEFCALTGHDRKHAIKLLNKCNLDQKQQNNQRGRKKKYGPEVVVPLKTIWEISDQMCSKRLKVAIPEWLPYYEKHRELLKEDVKEMLLSISAAQIDRVLFPYKVATETWRYKGVKPGTLIRAQIPIKSGPWEVTEPGYLEVDSVAHCGGSMCGNFVWSITYTDIVTGWTSIRATWNCGREGVVKQTKDVEDNLPFGILGFDCDNGHEFMNNHLHKYLTGRPKKVAFTRSRPYHKNDNAHVEQKNWTHVRQLLGYERFENQESVIILNYIYKFIWEPLNNYFCPCMKLIKKERVGSKYRKYYDDPKTPYQRLMDNNSISVEQKDKIGGMKQALDPFILKLALEEKLKLFFEAEQKTKESKMEAV